MHITNNDRITYGLIAAGGMAFLAVALLAKAPPATKKPVDESKDDMADRMLELGQG